HIESYEALSYALGSPTFPHTISVNGTEFKVREILFQALNFLRLHDTEMVLWIDAICINQSDICERNHEVQHMAEIYSRAHQILVWLGLETGTSRMAVEFLHNAALFSPRDRNELKEDLGWHALGDLCGREYWKRVWMIQEICLASRVK